jgi:hypothetical protein
MRTTQQLSITLPTEDPAIFVYLRTPGQEPIKLAAINTGLLFDLRNAGMGDVQFKSTAACGI